MRVFGRRSGTGEGWILVILALNGGVGSAVARTTTPGGVGQPSPAPQAQSVIVPHAGIDPAMRIKLPRLPPGSTPVIKPRTTPSPGSDTVVVPK